MVVTNETLRLLTAIDILLYILTAATPVVLYVKRKTVKRVLTIASVADDIEEIKARVRRVDERSEQTEDAIIALAISHRDGNVQVSPQRLKQEFEREPGYRQFLEENTGRGPKRPSGDDG